MFYVYMHVNKINNKKYIGITRRNPEVRWYNGKGYGHNQYFTNAINKYGWNNFEHIILFSNLTESEACLKEQELIKYYKSNTHSFGYNLESGGKYFNVNELTKKKISESSKGKKLSNKTKNKISNSEKGKIVSKETRDKISKANIERFKNPLERQKISETQKRVRKGEIHSAEHNRKVSEALKGKKYIHQGNLLKYVKAEDLDYYLSAGWKLGKIDKIEKEKKSMSEIKKGGCWICKLDKTKYVNSSDLVLYIQQGWQRGRKYKYE